MSSPGTIIHTDEWKVYTVLRNNTNYYGHQTVNHSVHFVDPTTHVHTQLIGNTWMRIKMKQKIQCGLARTRLPAYLEEFV